VWLPDAANNLKVHPLPRQEDVMLLELYRGQVGVLVDMEALLITSSSAARRGHPRDDVAHAAAVAASRLSSAAANTFPYPTSVWQRLQRAFPLVVPLTPRAFSVVTVEGQNMSWDAAAAGRDSLQELRQHKLQRTQESPRAAALHAANAAVLQLHRDVQVEVARSVQRLEAFVHGRGDSVTVNLHAQYDEFLDGLVALQRS